MSPMPNGDSAAPAIVRKRPCGVPGSSDQAGSQLTPLMWPQNKVGIVRRPAAAASSTTASSRSSISGSIASGRGWKSSQRRKKRTVSRPSPAIRAKSSRISPASKRRHIAIALRRGQ